MALTEKMRAFAQAYIANGGNGTQAYLTAYNGNSTTSAAIEASRLLDRDDMQEYLKALQKPIEKAAQETALNERDRKRAVLWDIVQNGDYNAKCRALDILNKMDAEYININRNIDDNAAALQGIDKDTLLKLSAGL